jgi:hypothetical protein
MQTNRELLISIDMCITSKHKVQQMKKLPQITFKINKEMHLELWHGV